MSVTNRILSMLATVIHSNDSVIRPQLVLKLALLHDSQRVLGGHDS